LQCRGCSASPLSAGASKGKERVHHSPWGLFFRSSRRGSLLGGTGQEIREDDVVCAIEVLQQRHQVNRRARANQTNLRPGTGQMVEFKQTLFLLELEENNNGTRMNTDKNA
jgi:biotin carboxyl carrier protein